MKDRVRKEKERRKIVANSPHHSKASDKFVFEVGKRLNNNMKAKIDYTRKDIKFKFCGARN